jgi:RNA polymerase sigma-70 factor (ECF subfamily)
MGGDVEELLRAHRYDEALERMLQDYQGKVFRMALTILRDAGRAEEVTQDVFLKLWRALPAYDGRAAVTTWLYTIARNTCLTAVRAAGYRRTTPLDDVTEPGAASMTPLKVSVDQCLGRLPEIQRQVITLFYLQDRNVSEVAAMLDLPEGTVKSHLHRARRALAAIMTSQPAAATPPEGQSEAHQASAPAPQDGPRATDQPAAAVPQDGPRAADRPPARKNNDLRRS